MGYEIVKKSYLTNQFDAFFKLALKNKKTTTTVVPASVTKSSSSSSTALEVVDDSTVVPGTGQIGLSVVQAIDPTIVAGDYVEYTAEHTVTTVTYENKYATPDAVNTLIESNEKIVKKADDDYVSLLDDEHTHVNWTEAEIDALFSLTDAQITLLGQILDDTQTTTIKGWSSSKIYEELQNIYGDAVAYVVKYVAKQKLVTYKKVDSTSEVTDDSTLYLVPNSSGDYEIYVYDSSAKAPLKVSSAAISMTDYYTKTESDDTFALKADAFTKDSLDTVPLDFDTEY